MENKLSPQYGKALELHNKILVSAQLAQNSLWEMCSGLKEMRDGKLYRELGYQNFEAYCEKEFNMNRSNAHKYISIIENIKPENVSTSKHFGVSKLYLLSTLSKSEQEKITAENDVESMTVKQLEKEIRELKDRNSELKNTEWELEQAQRQIKNLQTESRARQTTIDEQAEYIREMENRPIEVAVAEPTDEVRQLKLTIQNLERTTEKQLDDLQEEHIAAERRLRQEHEKELEIKLGDQAKYYEQKLAEAEQQPADADDRQVFKAYFTAAYDAFNRMLDFANGSENRAFFREKIFKLLEAVQNKTNEL